MKKFIILAIAGLLVLQATAQKEEYKVLADFRDLNNCPVSMIKSEGIYSIAYSNYLYLGSGFHDAFSTRDRKMLQTIFATVCAMYQSKKEDEVYKFQIRTGHAVILKMTRGDVFLLKNKGESVFYVSEDTALKLLEALK